MGKRGYILTCHSCGENMEFDQDKDQLPGLEPCPVCRSVMFLRLRTPGQDSSDESGTST